MSQLQIVLSGGPVEIPDEQRVQQVDALDAHVKLLRGNGRDHFEYCGESALHDGIELPRFVWVGHTVNAE